MRTTPSVIAFTEDGQKLVGQAAKRQVTLLLTALRGSKLFALINRLSPTQRTPSTQLNV